MPLPNFGKLVAGESGIIASSMNLNYPQVVVSVDGENWESIELPRGAGETQATSQTLFYGGRYFWISYQTTPGMDNTRLARSVDGIAWEELDPPNVPAYLAYGNGRLILGYSDPTYNVVSTDFGETFTSHPRPARTYHGVLFAGQRFFLGSSLSWSLDGVEWLDPQYADQLQSFAAVAYGNGRYVAVGTRITYPHPGTDIVAVWEADEPPSIVKQPVDRIGVLGGSVTFGEYRYRFTNGNASAWRWFRNGVLVPGARSTSLTVTSLSESDAGLYTLVAYRDGMAVSSDPAKLTLVEPNEASRLVNLSVRAKSGTGANTFITGFVLGGGKSGKTTNLLVRGVGPSLQEYGVADPLVDPQLEIHSAGEEKPETYTDWGGTEVLKDTFFRIGAFPLIDSSSRDAAVLLQGLGVGSHTVHLNSSTQTIGSTLCEIYDASESDVSDAPRLINLSSRMTLSGFSDSAISVGFVIAGRSR